MVMLKLSKISNQRKKKNKVSTSRGGDFGIHPLRWYLTGSGHGDGEGMLFAEGMKCQKRSYGVNLIDSNCRQQSLLLELSLEVRLAEFAIEALN